MKSKQGKYNSITSLMKALIKAKPEIGVEEATKEVKKFFPGSRFNKLHLSWYKSAFKRGVLKGARG